ncbi:hypothetical protein TVNIR_3229 [Thioalkalivibrio nitratireducens DSM 14787]|uniref:Uncharacterized protein n=1 Tax=Thioalkalivibrio nitratireducens (strain DSM 14787 / UNIQEM 213 / ALEN2) TaxID=1255043 RepID=L0E2M1_THIND|nr:hypothetical protein [Thioalkalivibrio nitratireducens]AGA34866.1 hypothetical protein TVNIR_3229 [Thioalkalivibrio nitratireducens DSM 14787]
MKLVKLVKLNNLQYNANRDPAFYRRPVNTEFRLQVVLNGTGEAKATFTVGDEALCENTITLPGTFDCRFSFDTPGTRVGMIEVDGNAGQYREKIRIDVLEHAPVG